MYQLHRLLHLNSTDDRCNYRRCGGMASLFLTPDVSRAGHPSGHIFQSLWPKVTSITVLTRHKHTGRSFKFLNTTVDPRDTCTHTETVNAITGPTAVYAPYHYIHLSQQAQADIIGDIATDGLHLYSRIHGFQTLSNNLHLQTTGISILL